MAETERTAQDTLKLPEAVRSPWWELTRRLLIALAILLTTVTLLHLALSTAAWHPSGAGADCPNQRTAVTSACVPRSTISPAKQHSHHSPAAHTYPGATTATSHRPAGPRAGNPAHPVPTVIPPATPPAPAHGPATAHDDNSRPRAILPHLLRC